jgi:1-acyl-sn-glycerol-3-phosphate acyltransferase
MRVLPVTPGPLFPDDGPWLARIGRRVRGIGIEIVLFIALTVLSPVLVLVAGAVDLALWVRRRKPAMALRMLGVTWWFLVGELTAYVWLLGIWLATGGPFGTGSLRRHRWIYVLRMWWIRHHLGAVVRLFGLRIDIQGQEHAAPGPAIVMMRHASVVDNALGDSIVTHNHGIGLRYVIKRELNIIPTIDIGGRWVPTFFARRGSGDAAGESAALRSLLHGIGPGESVLIYPEGTRATPAKIRRAKEIIAERRPDISPLAERLQNVLPPRLGGPLALLDEGAGEVDVVFCAHVGFDGFQHLRHLWAGGLVGATIEVVFWRCPASEIPTGEDERVLWLYENWQRVDDWIGERRGEVAAPPPEVATATG